MTNDDKGGNPVNTTSVHRTIMQGEDFQVYRESNRRIRLNWQRSYIHPIMHIKNLPPFWFLAPPSGFALPCC